MEKEIPDIIQNITKDLKDILEPLIGEKLIRIILYGSYSRLDYSIESDIDLFVLANLDESELSEVNEKLNLISVDLSLKYNTVLSVILRESKQFYAYANILPFYANIIKEGIIVYG